MRKKESVLCIHRDRLPSSWVKTKSILPLDLNTFVEECTQSGFDFIIRKEAEQNPDLKQVIPYILLQTQNSETAIYNRQGSEKRLHDLWSLGIGGHINPIDQKNKQASFKDILICGMERELDEELIKRPPLDQAKFVGIISEDITDVGSVHLGAVFQIITKTPELYLPGPELSQFQWAKNKELTQLDLELWSELALALISL